MPIGKQIYHKLISCATVHYPNFTTICIYKNVIFFVKSHSPLLSRALSQAKQYTCSERSLATHTHDDLVCPYLESGILFKVNNHAWKEVRTCLTGGQLRRVELLSVSHSDFNSTPAQYWFDFDGSTWTENLDRDTRVINCMGRCPLLTRAYGYERTTMQQHCVWWAPSGQWSPSSNYYIYVTAWRRS